MADAKYLQETVGPALTAGLASCASAQPDDPVDYLAHWLLKYLAVQEKKAQVSEAHELVKKEREAMDAQDQLKVEAEAANVFKLEQTKQKVAACTNIPAFYKAIVDGIRENTRANHVYIALLKPVPPEEDLDADGNPTPHADENVDTWEDDTRPAPAEGEEPLPEWVPPKIVPSIPKYSKLQYVFASEGNQWLKGKEIRSPFCKKSKDSSVAGGNGRDTVSFRAVMERGGRVIRNVMESVPELHFFDMPMPGSFACEALLRGETKNLPEGKNYLAGGVMGLMCCDTVDTEGSPVLDEKDGLVFKDLVATASSTYERLLEEARQRMLEEDAFAQKLFEQDIVLPTGEAAEGEEAPPNPEVCLAPEEGADAEKEIDQLEAEIATLSANLDKTNAGTGRIAVVKAAIKARIPEAKANEHGREIPDLAVGANDFEDKTPGNRVVKAMAKLVSSDITDLKETAGDLATAIQSFDIKTVTDDMLAEMDAILAEGGAITAASYSSLPFQARLLFALIHVAKDLSPHALRLAAKKTIKAEKVAAKEAAEAAAKKLAEEEAAAAAAAAESAAESAAAAPAES